MAADEQDSIPYADQPFDGSGTGQARALSADARRGEGNVLAYLGPSGTPLAWTGGDDAPFVRVLKDVPGIVPVSLIPIVADAGVLLCASVCASLHEVWANDSRSDTTTERWLLAFDMNRVAALVSGTTRPSYTAWLLCGMLSLDFTDAPLGFTSGIVLAVSSTPNVYTAIVPAANFSITARVLGG